MAAIPCVGCGRFYKIFRNGVLWEEMKPTYGGNWESYKLWIGDLYKCEGCGSEIIAGTGFREVASDYQPEYDARRLQYGPVVVQVNDCTGAYDENERMERIKHG